MNGVRIARKASFEFLENCESEARQPILTIGSFYLDATLSIFWSFVSTISSMYLWALE